MKLFQQMLVAGAALSLIAPIGAQASDVNIEEIDTYVRKQSSSKNQKRLNSNSFSNELVTIKQKVNSSQFNLNQLEAGSFSDTTTLDGKVIMALGAIDGIEELTSDTGATHFNTVYQMNLNSSFTGDDNMYIRLKGGEWASEAY